MSTIIEEDGKKYYFDPPYRLEVLKEIKGNDPENFHIAAFHFFDIFTRMPRKKKIIFIEVGENLGRLPAQVSIYLDEHNLEIDLESEPFLSIIEELKSNILINRKRAKND